MKKKRSAPVRYVQPYRYPSPNIPLSAIRRFARQIAERFHPDKIILFGSYAYGTPHEESDVDLMVIMPARNVIDQAIRIDRAFECPFALDLHVRTPYQIKLGLKEGDCDWFLREVMEKGKVLHEASHGSVGKEVGRIARSSPSAYHSGSHFTYLSGSRRNRAMQSRGANDVGRVNVDVEIANNDDLALVRRGMLAPDQVRRETIPGVVDSGAAMLVLPEAVVERLGLRLGNPVQVRYADGRRARRREAKGVTIKLLGREDTFTAVIEPKRPDALIGAIVLEALDLLVDCKGQRVFPRDPRIAIYEIE